MLCYEKSTWLELGEEGLACKLEGEVPCAGEGDEGGVEEDGACIGDEEEGVVVAGIGHCLGYRGRRAVRQE